MIYLAGVILLFIAVSCIHDIILKLVILSSGVECSAEIEKFQEHRSRSMSASKGDMLQYRAVIKYTDEYGREYKAITPKLYERWESECLVGREVTILYYRRNPEKIVMEKRELIRPVAILSIVLMLPLLYLLVNYYLLLRFFKSLSLLIK